MLARGIPLVPTSFRESILEYRTSNAAGRDSSPQNRGFGMTKEESLDPHAVFRTVEGTIFACVAEALVGHALR